jgi:hypothetical protein
VTSLAADLATIIFTARLFPVIICVLLVQTAALRLAGLTLNAI